MTAPTPTAPAPEPTPTDPTPPAEPDKPTATAPVDADELTRRLKAVENTLASERGLRTKAEKRLAEQSQAAMTETEKAIATAKDEGRAEALKQAGQRLALAEFRARAVGKLADPDAAVEYLDVAKFVKDDGEPDTDAIQAAVDKLAALVGKPAAPNVPNGPRPDPGESDWLRSVIKTR